MFHLSPQTGEIFIHELEPSLNMKYNLSIQLQKGDVLHQMQVVDNLLVVHNIDQKSTNFYDVKLAEYNQPICAENLDVDTSYSLEYYHSDQIFPEETAKSNVDDTLNVDETESEKLVSDQAVQSKEYLEVDFKFNFTGEDDKPINIGIDIGTG